MDILCVGQIAADVLLWPVDKLDFTVDTTRIEGVKLSCGGDCLNTSIALQKLGFQPGLISMVGKDVFGDFLLRSISELGIPVGGICTHPQAPTTVAVVVINQKSDRVFYYLPGACDSFSFQHIAPEEVQKAKLVHLGGFYQMRGFDETSAMQLMKYAKENGKTTAMDVTWNTAGNWDCIQKVLPYVDYFFPSYNEAKEIAGLQDVAAIAKKLRQMGAKNVIVKLGKQGGYADDGTQPFFFPAFAVPAVDTTGAGDCFAAGLLAGLAQGWGLGPCTRFASAVSAFGVQSVGATAGIPNAQAVFAFLDTRCPGWKTLATV